MTSTSTETAPRTGALAGFRIGVTSDRRSDDLILALERRGAEVLHAPAMRIAPNGQDETLLEETRAIIRARPEVVMITTGYGMRRWFEVADAAGLGAELTAVLDDATIMARGPKAVGAVRAAGLDDTRISEHESTAAMVDDLTRTLPVTRRSDGRVAVQVHGYTDEAQLERLRRVSAEVLLVTPYRWVAPASPLPLLRLIEAAAHRQLDAITFTSGPSVEATLTAAREAGLESELLAAMSGDVLAVAVGPMTAAPLISRGLAPAVPERHRMGAMIRLLCQRLGEDGVQRFRAGPQILELRGRGLSIGDRAVRLGPNASALLRTLASTRGVVTRRELLSCLPKDTDEHTLEVAISRLRRSLALPGVISTVVKRGYRLNVEPLPPGLRPDNF